MNDYREWNYHKWHRQIKISSLGWGGGTSSYNAHAFPESDPNQGDVTKECAELGETENGFCETKMSAIENFNMVYWKRAQVFAVQQIAA